MDAASGHDIETVRKANGMPAGRSYFFFPQCNIFSALTSHARP